MTLIVGIVCKDAIVFGSETETTRGDSKFQKARKLHLVSFAKGDAVIIGAAGVERATDGMLEIISKMAAQTALQTDETVPKTIENAFREFNERAGGPPLGSRERQEFYGHPDNYFSLIVGYYFLHQACIREFDPYCMTMAIQPKRDYSIKGVGAGQDLAQYLLSDFELPSLDSREAMILACHVVREVKAWASNCGGNTEIAVMSDGNGPEILAADSVERFNNKIGQLNEEIRASRIAKIQEAMRYEVPQYLSSIWPPEPPQPLTPEQV